MGPADAYANRACVSRTACASRATSSDALYTQKLARTVAGTPNVEGAVGLAAA